MYHSLSVESAFDRNYCIPASLWLADAIILEAEKLLGENVSRRKPAYSINFTNLNRDTCPTQPKENPKSRQEINDFVFSCAVLQKGIFGLQKAQLHWVVLDMWEVSHPGFRFD